ncbi:MAG: radical SAM protein, partial [Planctomycetes bacterium]|nr:radical SAM protein [Planctomycetota bacterium]
VLSRRSGGISIGVNLNRDKRCNFDCVYCQVDRARPGETERESVDLGRLAAELDATVRLVTSGRLYEDDKFRHVPPALRRLNDIALSGDGEPTACTEFAEAVALSAEIRRRHRLDDLKLILLTNASLLDRDRVRRGLEILDHSGGEIWAKLDAGTEEHYRRVARSPIAFERILNNLEDAARMRPLVIQSLFMRIDGEPPGSAEQEAYCQRLSEIIAGGGRIKLVQLHTVAREPSESWVTPLSNQELDALAALVRRQTQLPVAVYYGRSTS